MKPTTDPSGIESPLSAVARPLSLSPNHLLQIMFCAQRKIGLANEITKEPATIGQNLLLSYVLSCLNQQPTNNTIDPSLKVHALEKIVNIFMLVKNIGTAVIPKHSVHRLTCNSGTL